jgi:hypothetical protein
MLQEISPEKRDCLKSVSLSRATMTQLVEDISSNLIISEKEKGKRGLKLLWMREIIQAILSNYESSRKAQQARLRR